MKNHYEDSEFLVKCGKYFTDMDINTHNSKTTINSLTKREKYVIVKVIMTLIMLQTVILMKKFPKLNRYYSIQKYIQQRMEVRRAKNRTARGVDSQKTSYSKDIKSKRNLLKTGEKKRTYCNKIYSSTNKLFIYSLTKLVIRGK